jgi:protein-tyrosine phosphatase
MKVLMVCLGNICRSPLAEGVLAHKANELGIEMEVDSAGTSGWHIGEGPDSRSAESGLVHGIDISKQRSRKFVQNDFDAFDIIFVMDQSNQENALKLARSQQDRDKVRLILDEIESGSGMEVPDPYYGGDGGFEHVYQLLDTACDQFLLNIQQT